MKTFAERLREERPLLYDGGFGSQLFSRGVELTNSTLANELNAEVVQEIHLAYIEAGSEAIGTNTFVANALHLEMADREGDAADEIARLAVRNARAAVERSGREVYIGGSMGPSPGAIEADAGDPTFGIPDEKVREAHRRLATALAEGGVDYFMIETQFSANEAAMAVDEARTFGLPIAVSMTYKATTDRKTGEVIYRTDWGHSPASLVEALSSGAQSEEESLMPYVHVLGLNCGAETKLEAHTGMSYGIEGVRQTRAALAESGVTGKRLIAYPNAGMPSLDRSGVTTYSHSPEQMASELGALLETGAFIVGGCCGTGPEHIAAMKSRIDRIGHRE